MTDSLYAGRERRLSFAGAVKTPAVTVNPVQTTTYGLTPSDTPITFGAGTDIEVAGAGIDAVSGGVGATYTITNDGLLSSKNAYSIHLAGAGKVTNAGTLLGQVGFGGAAALINSGSMTGGATFAAFAQVTNSGTIIGGLRLGRGGKLTNQAHSRIFNEGGVGVTAAGAPLTFSNAGYIYGSSVALGVHNGGAISNVAGGALQGNEAGLHIYKSVHPATVTNGGGIYGGMSGPGLPAYGILFEANGGTIDNLAGGQIDGPSNALVIRGNGVTLSNAGTVDANSNFGSGVVAAKDTVNNQLGGVISGYFYGATLKSGTVVNVGLISGFKNAGVFIDSSGGAHGAVDNSGTITGGAAGVVFQSLGLLTNEATGTISGALGVGVVGGSADNAGTITGVSTYGVSLNDGVALSNRAGGVITGKTYGVHAGLTAITVTNAGKIMGSTKAGVALGFGGTVDNAKGGVVTGRTLGVRIAGGLGTIDNSGQITGGVSLLDGGEVINRFEAAISGATGFYVGGAVGSVVNNGQITGGTTVGIDLHDGGAVSNQAKGVISSAIGVRVRGAAAHIVNSGQISGIASAGIELFAGGFVTNQAGASITASSDGVAVLARTATVTNSGLISGMNTAVALAGGGLVANRTGGLISGVSFGVAISGTNAKVTNQAGGSISGATGVYFSGSAGTITNAGTIKGSTDAVLFSGAGANKLVLQTGSVLVGKVVGSTASGATNELDLQGSGVSNNSFLNFASLGVAASGVWTLDSVLSFGAASITAGTLQIGDATHTHAKLTISGALLNRGVLAVAGGLVDVVGAVTGFGSVAIGRGTLELGSTFTQKVVFNGDGGMLQLANSLAYTATISGFSLTGGTKLDLRDIHNDADTAAAFKENGSHTGGVLTVTDGTHTAHLKLAGDYSGATFLVAGDGHGGVTVTAALPPMSRERSPDTFASRATASAIAPFIAAMASFDTGAGHWTSTSDSGRASPVLLARAARPDG